MLGSERLSARDTERKLQVVLKQNNKDACNAGAIRSANLQPVSMLAHAVGEASKAARRANDHTINANRFASKFAEAER
jgi:hypothetical protein